MVVEDNPFVRFKNHIDTNVRRGWDVVVGSFVFPPTSPVSSPSPPSSGSAASTTTTTASTTTAPAAATEQSNSATFPSITPSPSRSCFKMPYTPSEPDKASTATMTSTAPTSPTSPTVLPPSDPEEASITTIDEVHAWTAHSPYSPLNLQHLRQPVPRDAPPGCDDGNAFDFRDAFEDLLVSGSGAPLSMSRTPGWKKCLFGGDSAVEKRRKELHWGRFRTGWLGRDGMNTLRTMEWVTHLGARGLWDAYFPTVVVGVSKGRDKGKGKGKAGSGRPAYRDDWENFQNRAAVRLFLPGSTFDVDVDADSDASGDGMVRANVDFGSRNAWERTWRRGWGFYRDEEEDGGRRDNLHRRGDADFEDELYKAFDSAFSRPDPDSKKGLRATTTSAPGDQVAGSSSSEPETSTTVYPDGSKLVRKTEQVNADGKTEVSTTEHYYDAQGNLISESRSKTKTRSWSGSLPGGNAGASVSWSWGSNGSRSRSESGSPRDEKVDGAEKDADRKDEKNGWFWRR